MTIRNTLLACCGILLVSPVWGQYKPGDFQSGNPNYPDRNPFYFEGRVDWNLLKIDQPSNAWEFAQRGIYRQEDLEDIPGAIADYRQSYARNNLGNGTCQLITSPAGLGRSTNPAPCMFTVRLRLGYLLRESSPNEAIGYFKEVIGDPKATPPIDGIDPLRLGVNQMIGDVYRIIAEQADNDDGKITALKNAVAAYKAELELSPVTPLSIKLTADEENNAHTHWALAEVYHELGDVHEACELDKYLKATKWHSDTYAWRIQLAQTRLPNLSNPCPAEP